MRLTPGETAQTRAWTMGPAAALAALLFAEHFLLGVNSAPLGLAAATLHGLALLGALQSSWFRSVIVRGAPAWGGPGLLFTAALALAVAAAFGALPPEPLAPIGAWSGSISRQATLIEAAKLGGLGCLFLVAFGVGSANQGLNRLCDALLIFGAAFAAYALLAHFGAPGRILWMTKYTAQDRLTGNFISANTAASLFAMLLALQTTHLNRRMRHARAAPAYQAHRLGLGDLVAFWPDAAGLILFLACLVLTGSRAGIIVGVGAVMISAVLNRPREGRGRAALWPYAIMPLVLLMTGGLVANRFGSLLSEFRDRNLIVWLHGAAASQRPIWGYGLGSFRDVNRHLANSENFGSLQAIGAVHNLYLQWWEQAGAVGTAVMFGAITWALARVGLSLKARRKRSGGQAVLICSAILLIHGIFDYGLEVPSIAAMWAVLLGAGVGHAAAETKAPKGQPLPA